MKYKKIIKDIDLSNNRIWDIVYVDRRQMVVATNRECKLILIDYPAW